MLNAGRMFRKIMLSFKNKLMKRVKGLAIRTVCHRMTNACASSDTLSSNSITAHLRKDHLSTELLIVTRWTKFAKRATNTSSDIRGLNGSDKSHIWKEVMRTEARQASQVLDKEQLRTMHTARTGSYQHIKPRGLIPKTG